MKEGVPGGEGRPRNRGSKTYIKLKLDPNAGSKRHGQMSYNSKQQTLLSGLLMNETGTNQFLMAIKVRNHNVSLQSFYTCNIESCIPCDCTLCRSPALYHCAIQSNCSSDCQGGGHVSHRTTCYSDAVGSGCKDGHKGDVTALWRCDTIAVHTSPNGSAI